MSLRRPAGPAVLGWRNLSGSLVHGYLKRRNISTRAVRNVAEVQDDNLQVYKRIFNSAKPTLLKRGIFKDLPAARKWFEARRYNGVDEGLNLNVDFLEKFGELTVPLEVTGLPKSETSNLEIDNDEESDETFDTFEQGNAPLSFFLEFVGDAQKRPSSDYKWLPGVYLAQCSIADLNESLCRDLPTPDFVSQAGRGDVYDSSIWIGLPPTFTPLHRDPNPNLFVQLAGSKTVRLMEPAVGNEVFQIVQKQLRRTGSGSIRGEEMMQGPEKKLLKELVWGEDSAVSGSDHIYEVSLEPGDGLFIPEDWWHSVVGHGNGIIGSVNWWFR